MRKHFLILMLLSLLPLAGWAQIDISDATAGVAAIEYGSTGALTIEVRKDGAIAAENYTVDANFYEDEGLTTVAKKEGVAMTRSQLQAKTYYIKVTGKEDKGYTGTKAIALKVNKKNVTATLSTQLTKVYGAADPALLADNINWTSTAFVTANGDDKTVFSGSYTYTYDGENVGTYAINVTGLTADNYTLTITGDALKITAKPLTASMITKVDLSETYKSAKFTSFAVDVKDGSKTLVAGTDFDVKVYSNEAMTTLASDDELTNATAAGTTLYLGIVAKTGANYSVASTLAAGTFKIKKAGLTIRALAQERSYTGNATIVSDKYEVLGKIGSDAIGAVTLTAKESDLTTAAKADAGSKVIIPSVGTENANYDYNYVNATFTINKRTLTITPAAAKKVLNQTDGVATKMDGSAGDATYGYAGLTIEPVLDEGEATWEVPSAELTLMKAEYATTNNDTKKNGTLRVVRTGKGTDEAKKTYKDALSISYATAGTVWKNYTVDGKTADFTITGGKIYVTALGQEKNYGDAEPDWTAELDKNYIVSGLSAGESLKKAPTLTRAEGETVNDYVITISGAEAPEGYEEIVYANATFKIKKRPLVVTAKPQTLKKGQTASDLDQTLYTITSGTLKTGDTAAEVFALAFATTASADPVIEVPNMSTTGTYRNGIQIAAGAKGANYDLTACVGADLIVVDATAIVLNDNADITTTAATGKDVTFTSRVLKGNQWNVLVLPFKTSAKAISEKLDYAVIDVFDTSASDGNVHFKLNVTAGNSAADYIAANTPFLVYPTKDINMNTITFTSVDVVATTDNVEVSDGGGNKFIGTYKSTSIAGEKYRYMSNGTFYDAKNYTATNPATIKPLRAYLDLTGSAAAAPVIFIDEPDGTVTAIETVVRDSESLNTEGAWYKLNGMKIEGKPTEKGIYIKNGKKVVIK